MSKKRNFQRESMPHEETHPTREASSSTNEITNTNLCVFRSSQTFTNIKKTYIFKTWARGKRFISKYISQCEDLRNLFLLSVNWYKRKQNVFIHFIDQYKITPWPETIMGGVHNIFFFHSLLGSLWNVHVG